MVAYEIVTNIRALYRSDAPIALVLDWASSRSRDAKETSVDRLVDQLQIAKPQAIRICRQLQEAGCGRFFYGRRGSKSRIRWFYSLRSLGKAAKGDTSQLEEIDYEFEDESAAEMQIKTHGEARDRNFGGTKEYHFPLRPDMNVMVSLPEDLTIKEAERFARFIQSLPFES